MIKLKNNQSSLAEYAKNFPKRILADVQKNSEKYVLEVDSSNFMNLQYLILLLQLVKKQKSDFRFDLSFDSPIKGASTIAQRERNEDWGRISTYLSCFRESLFKNKPIFNTNQNNFNYSGLQNPKDLSFGRIIPLIPVDHEIYEFLIDRVEKVFAPSISDSLPKHFVASCKRERNVFVDKNGKQKTTKTLVISPKGASNSNNDGIKVLYEACKKYLFGVDRRSSNDDFFQLFEERITKYTSYEFFGKVKNMSVLSFLIFCAHNRFSLLDGLDNIQNDARERGKSAIYRKDILYKEHLFPDDLSDDEILINAMDMADGLLQLIENTVFHAGEGAGKESGKDGVGLLSIRIFKKGQRSWDKYLKQQYAYYFKGDDNRNRVIQIGDSTNGYAKTICSLRQFQDILRAGLETLTDEEVKAHLENKSEIEAREKVRMDVSFYLEVKLIDHSGKNMCNVFVDNHKEDLGFPFNKENVQVSTFFDPTDEELEKWRVFNSNPANVVHHYGLQFFDALLQSVDGCFVAQSIADGEIVDEKNFYSSSGDQLHQQGDNYFPGTQYSILMPFCKRERKDYSFINTNVEYPLPLSAYTTLDKSNDDLQPFITKLIEYGEEPYTTQEQKNSYIIELNKVLAKFYPTENNIIIFDSNDLNVHNIELFAKSLMQFIAVNSDKEINIAITNCNEDSFKQLVRIFAIFYDRTGKNEFMKKTQIYLSSEDSTKESRSKDEFLLAGANLKDMLVAQIKLDVARGITRGSNSGTLSFLLDMLERRPGKGIGNKPIKYVPFDLLVKNNGVSVFERNVLNVLRADVQNKNPGCKIFPNHMRIGSKIHVDSFYEALVLFSNNYFTGRFAWLIKEKITRTIHLKDPTVKSPFLFIGYETYSEMLLRDLCKLFTDSEYCIFEYGTQDMFGKQDNDRFRHTENISTSKVYKPVFIVPINSTSSTFNKLEATFNREVVKHNKGNTNQSDQWCLYPTAIYLGVIQTRHYISEELSNIEKEFFKGVDTLSGRIESRLVTKTINGQDVCQDVYYLFCVQSNWSNPLRCEQCYPSCYFAERPLIETDKTSVIPAQLYGLKDEEIVSGKYNDYNGTSGSIYDLKNHILFGHTYRGSNHFQYYIKTGEYFEYVNRKDADGGKSSVHLWLDEVKKQITYSSILHYDVIVCPEHYSNSGFVKLVNDVVFDGASLVISIDFGKEFRDNFKAKHSDLSNLFINFRKQNCDAEICFHFVDDTIIHGSNISRVRSLAYSLFPIDAHMNIGKIKINVFKSIILLINRNSSDSIMNYVSEYMAFHSFLNLNVSSLRTHDNACVLCQEGSDSRRLSYRSASLELSNRFERKSNRLCKKEVSSEDKKPNVENETLEFLRFICTHNLNCAYSRLKAGKNQKYEVFKALVNEIIQKLCLCGKKGILEGTDSLSLLISYIEVASAPFISFRKSSREAVFDLILIIFGIILSNNKTCDFEESISAGLEKESFLDEEDRYEKLKILQCEELKTLVTQVLKYISDPVQLRDFLKVLIKQSVALKSNFIIRRENIVRILLLSFVKEFDKKQKQGELDCFADYYLYHVKKLIASGTDEAKAMILEFLVLTGEEYSGIDTIPCNNELGTNFIKYSNESGINTSLNAEQLKNFNNSLREFLRRIYIENTQIIYDAANDWAKGDIPKSEKGRYFLENYTKLLKWNNEPNENDTISIELGNLIKKFDEVSGDVTKYFTSLAQSFSKVLSASLSIKEKDRPIICFLSERTDPFLTLTNGFVRTIDQTVLDCFSVNDESLYQKYTHENTSEANELMNLISQAQELHNDPKKEFILSTYKVSENNAIYLIRFGYKFRTNEFSSNNVPIIQMLISLPADISEYQRIKAIRYILAFRHQICKKIEEYFKNDLLSKELQSITIKKQMQKARAGDHIDEEKNDIYNPNLFAESVYCNLDLEESFINYTKNEALYGYFINSTLGRVNIKLLAKADMGYEEATMNEYATDKNLIETLSRKLSSIANLPRKNLVKFMPLKGSEIAYNREALEKYFNTEFYLKTLLRNANGHVPQFKYIVAFVAELINSASKYASDPKEVHIHVDAHGYLCVTNKVLEDFTMDSIMEGLQRKGDGISLATTCGFFDYFYKVGANGTNGDNIPCVKINLDRNILQFCLPLFNSQEEQK